jgi:multidrug efflux pump subunit AcrA (membrane-fusion protein)
VGWLEIDDKSRELLVFPESALLRSNEGPHVLVAGPSDGTFARRSLQIGRILKGHVVVLSGLREDERIVVSNAFFLDPDRSREPRSEPIAGALP